MSTSVRTGKFFAIGVPALTVVIIALGLAHELHTPTPTCEASYGNYQYARQEQAFASAYGADGAGSGVDLPRVKDMMAQALADGRELNCTWSRNIH